MSKAEEDSNYDKFKNQGTDSHAVLKDKIIVYPFDKYEITIKLSPDNTQTNNQINKSDV